MYSHQSLPLHLSVFMYLGASILGGYSLFLYCSFYHYIVSSSLSLFTTFKVYFVRYEHCYNHFLVISSYMKYLFHTFTLNLCVSSALKWVSHMQHIQLSSVQSLSRVQLFGTPWTTACQASLSITNSRSLPKLMSI